MTADPNRAKAIFLEALENHAPDQWPAFLDQACAGQPELRGRVEVLLAAHREAGTVQHQAHAQGPAAPPSDVRGAVEAPGTVIGPYKLLQQIGEGGMGTVWMAEQTQPVRRKVALKIIKPGMDTRQVIARFEAERQALAMMAHVNIARVFDGGTTGSGRPYFVMELVHGVPITKYSDDNHLTPRERLELFVPVCQAIQHAHQKGIIHRDIKPSNVMITLYDGKPVPKVIDFGVAKATEQKLTERTLFTQYGTMVGTLEYMSPEQAEMSALGVDTRSDIYSLGVLLYELLTGSTPLTHKRMKEAAYAEILRMIKEEEPPKPSTRLSDSGEALASISAQRHMEPAKLTKLVRGELDWIVMKTLEKDRNCRYETANGFAADVQRYLSDEPVQACPPSAGYRFKKLMRRHKGPALAAAVVAAALVLGIAGTLVGLARALAAERDAVAARDVEVRQQQEAVTQRDRALTAESAARANEARAKDEEHKAKQSAAEAQAVLGFFQDRVLAAARPQGQDGGLGIDATVRQAVDAAEPQIAPSFADQPTVEASVRNVLGLTYWYLGEAALASRQFERSLEVRRRVLGPDHPDSITSMNELANAYRDDGKLGRALPLFEEALKRLTTLLGPDHPDTPTVMNNLGNAHWAAGRPDRAMPLHEEALKRRTAQLGPDHPHTLHSMNNLAEAYHYGGKLDEALPLLEETLKRRQARLGVDHPDTLTSMNNLASAYWAANKLDRSVPLFEATLKLVKAKLGPEHPRVLGTMFNLAVNYH